MYCTGCGAQNNDDAAFCSTCGAAMADVNQGDNDSILVSDQSKWPLISSAIALVVIFILYFSFDFLKNKYSIIEGELVLNDDSRPSIKSPTENADESQMGLEGQLELAIERNPSFEHCGLMSYYLAENLSSVEIIDYSRSGMSVEVSARPGYENLVRNKKARFGDDRMEPWFCPGDIDVSISNFIPPSQGQNSVIVKYSWRTTNIPSKVQSLIDQGLLVVTRPENPNEEADFEPFHDAKEFVYSGESKMVLVQANNGWIPQESF